MTNHSSNHPSVNLLTSIETYADKLKSLVEGLTSVAVGGPYIEQLKNLQENMATLAKIASKTEKELEAEKLRCMETLVTQKRNEFFERLAQFYPDYVFVAKELFKDYIFLDNQPGGNIDPIFKNFMPFSICAKYWSMTKRLEKSNEKLPEDKAIAEEYRKHLAFASIIQHLPLWSPYANFNPLCQPQPFQQQPPFSPPNPAFSFEQNPSHVNKFDLNSIFRPR